MAHMVYCQYEGYQRIIWDYLVFRDIGAQEQWKLLQTILGLGFRDMNCCQYQGYQGNIKGGRRGPLGSVVPNIYSLIGTPVRSLCGEVSVAQWGLGFRLVDCRVGSRGSTWRFTVPITYLVTVVITNLQIP